MVMIDSQTATVPLSCHTANSATTTLAFQDCIKLFHGDPVHTFDGCSVIYHLTAFRMFSCPDSGSGIDSILVGLIVCLEVLLGLSCHSVANPISSASPISTISEGMNHESRRLDSAAISSMLRLACSASATWS